ncbi:Cof-type HAD-IIB family hydrolase [Clostridium felsineum]|uniref:Phosphatase YwpJ n=1 Tax=Clostridium felsineum TaxID=36839 RepID=A0A1S8L7W5_9CLOT|nr:Cof-type HAD-IIB family hydrolase [Clostridium felsineum]URZ03592.1 Phosphatase YwpJ [Clostridium felsineum]URZ08092.1 Phosphatase YwpJ [Clostridium felsineum]URZ13123.1 Phosphatase YwpJ [Clostridium felsineum]
MKYKLICIDMDGTLLNSKRRISYETKEAIREAHLKGIDIVITTGRIYSNAAFYSELIGVKSPVIASNGAIIRGKNDKIIYEKAISVDILLRITEICNKLQGRLAFHTKDSAICGSKIAYLVMCFVFFKSVMKGDSKIKYINNYNRYLESFGKDDKIIKCEIVDISANKIAALKEELKKIDDIELVCSSRYNIEITAKSASKGNAIKILSQQYGVKREEIIAIGDSENDLSMIEYGGVGVAMGNGVEKVKKIADYITDTNDNDGVAKVIRKFAINEE